MKALTEICRSIHRLLVIVAAASFVYLFAQQRGPAATYDEIENNLDNYARLSRTGLGRFVATAIVDRSKMRGRDFGAQLLRKEPGNVWNAELGRYFSVSLRDAGVVNFDLSPSAIEWHDDLLGVINEEGPSLRTFYCATSQQPATECEADALSSRELQVIDIRRMLIRTVFYMDYIDLTEGLRRSLSLANVSLSARNVVGYNIEIRSRLLRMSLTSGPELYFSGIVHLRWSLSVSSGSSIEEVSLPFYFTDQSPGRSFLGKSPETLSESGRIADWLERSYVKNVEVDLGLVSATWAVPQDDGLFPDPAQSTSAHAGAVWGSVANFTTAAARAEINKRRSTLVADMKVLEISFVESVAAYAIPLTVLALQWLLLLHVRQFKHALGVSSTASMEELPAWIGLYSDRASKITMYMSLSAMPAFIVLWSARFSILYDAGLVFVAAGWAATSAVLGVKIIKGIPEIRLDHWRQFRAPKTKVVR